MKEFRKPLLQEVAVDITASRKAFAGNEREMASTAVADANRRWRFLIRLPSKIASSAPQSAELNVCA
jgi:hypothetical protein